MALGLLSAACGSGNPGSGGSGGTASTSGGAGPSGPGAQTSTSAFMTGGGGAPSYGCSPDLKQVIDANGVVVKTCPPDQGCAGGQCVAACDAAASSQGNVGCDFMMSTPEFFAGLLRLSADRTALLRGLRHQQLGQGSRDHGHARRHELRRHAVRQDRQHRSEPRQLAGSPLDGRTAGTGRGALLVRRSEQPESLTAHLPRAARDPRSGRDIGVAGRRLRRNGEGHGVARHHERSGQHLRHSSVRRRCVVLAERRARLPHERMGNQLRRRLAASFARAAVGADHRVTRRHHRPGAAERGSTRWPERHRSAREHHRELHAQRRRVHSVARPRDDRLDHPERQAGRLHGR